MSRGVALSVGATLGLLLGLATPASAAFNEVVSGARPQGMGGAFVAVADDVNALYWNPAALTLTRAAEIGFFRANSFDLMSGPDLNLDFLGYSSGPMPYGSWGVSFFRHALRNVIEERMLGFSYGINTSENTSFGLNLKTVALISTPTGNFREDPAYADQSTVTFDLGMTHVLSPQFRFAASARNLGGRLGVVTSEPLSQSIRAGIAADLSGYFLKSDKLVLALDLATRKDIDDEAGTKVITHVGLEYAPIKYATFRAGVDDGKLTAGLGFSAFSFNVEYAFAEEEIGNTQIVSFSYKFESEVHVIEHHHHLPTRLEGATPPRAK